MADTSCSISSLTADARCFNCLSSKEKAVLQIWLMAQSLKASGGLDLTTPKALSDAVKCFKCESNGTLDAFDVSIAKQEATLAGASVNLTINQFRDQIKCWACLDPKTIRSAKTLLRCQLTGPGGDSGTSPKLGLIGDWTTTDSGTNAFLTDNGTFSPAIKFTDQVNYDFSWIEFANGTLTWGGSGAPIGIDLSGLVTVPTSGVFIITFSNCTSLATIIPPTALGNIVDGGLIFNFNNCALNQASVDGLLNALAADVTVQNCMIDLSGGTSAGPSGIAITSKATLISRGCTVSTN